MAYFDFIWTDEAINHIAQHGISQEDFEEVVCQPQSKGFSRSSGLPAAWGHTSDGRYLIVVYEEVDEVTILPISAYEVPEPR
jgi:uncharacterized DUF497 family protein